MGTLLPSTTGSLISSAVGMLASFIPYDKKVFDISAAGAKICISAKDAVTGAMTVNPVIVEHFANDQPAFKMEDITLNETAVSANGNMASWKGVPKTRITIAVIPNTLDDKYLSTMVQYDILNDVAVTQEVELEISIPRQTPGDCTSGEMLKVTFTGGRIATTPAGAWIHGSGASTDTEGKLQGKLFSFDFCKWKQSTEKIPEKSWLSSVASALIG